MQLGVLVSAGLLSRQVELRAIHEFLQSAAERTSGLVIEGEAGIGKTTLWLAAQDDARARGFEVLSARVGETESVLAYAAVADLLGDLDPAILAKLPDLQRLAVDRVLLRASSTEGPETDQRVVAAAFTAAVEHVAVEKPLLLAIDNVQWLDTSSQTVLAFAARRFSGRVGVLATERCDPDGGTSPTWLHLARPDGVERVRIGPLSLGGLHALISARLGRSFARPTMVRIAEISGGNPFYALELARAIHMGSARAQPSLPGTLAELMRLRIGSKGKSAMYCWPPRRRRIQRLSCWRKWSAPPPNTLWNCSTRPNGKASSRSKAIACGFPIRCWRTASTPTPVPRGAERCTGRYLTS